MLDFIEIIRSKLGQKLLAYFFTNPTAQLYVREIASILRKDAGNISKELNRLEKAGIFTSSTRGRQKHFSLNRKHPLYKELRSIIFKTVGVEGSLKNIIGKAGGIVLSLLYGSFAEDKETGASDIDLLIVGKPDEAELMKKIEALEKSLSREINYNIYPVKEFKDRIRKKDSFILNILKRPKIILEGSINEFFRSD